MDLLVPITFVKGPNLSPASQKRHQDQWQPTLVQRALHPGTNCPVAMSNPVSAFPWQRFFLRRGSVCNKITLEYLIGRCKSGSFSSLSGGRGICQDILFAHPSQLPHCSKCLESCSQIAMCCPHLMQAGKIFWPALQLLTHIQTMVKLMICVMIVSAGKAEASLASQISASW